MPSSARQIAALAVLLLALAACVPVCGIGAKFELSNARVDSSYNCPNGSNNHAYEVNAGIDASNTLGNTVTIKSIDESDELVATAGQWNGPKTAKGGGVITDYKPRSVASGQNTTIKFTIGFECTSSGPTVPTYAEFSFMFTVKTSSGDYTISAGNRHRLNFPTA